MHGIKRESLDQQFIEEIQVYARMAVQCFYIFCNSYSGKKGDFLGELDQAILDTSKSDMFKAQITEGFKDLTLNIPRTFGKYGKIKW